MTFLTWVRIMERMLALFRRRLSFCRARFRAWGELATGSPQRIAVERREMILTKYQMSKKFRGYFQNNGRPQVEESQVQGQGDSSVARLETYFAGSSTDINTKLAISPRNFQS